MPCRSPSTRERSVITRKTPRRFRGSSTRRLRGRSLWPVAAPVALAVVGALAAAIAPRPFLEITDSRSGESYFLRRAGHGSRVNLSWTHSVDRTPWIERYVIARGRFALRDVLVKSFVSGLDVDVSHTTTSDGWVAMDGAAKSFPTLRFIHSPDVGRRLVVNDRDIDLAGRIPDYASVEVHVRSAPAILTALIKK